MARLIEVERPEACPSPLAIRVGDMLLIRATGGRVRRGGSVVELLGPFLQAVVGTGGSVMAPEGPPGAVLVRARRPGVATVEVFTGDPWRAPRTTSLKVNIERSAP
jgi:hypothetical protein